MIEIRNCHKCPSLVYCTAFFLQLVRTNVADLLLVQMTIHGKYSYFGHIFQDVESQYPHRCVDWQPHIHLKTLDSSALEPCRSTTPCTEDNSTHGCNSRLSNRDGDKEAKLMDCSFNIINVFTITFDQFNSYRIKLLISLLIKYFLLTTNVCSVTKL